MRNEVKSNLLQALGAAHMIEPLDATDQRELRNMQDRIKATLAAWDQYDKGIALEEES